MKFLDIIRTSASRPDLLKISTESLSRYLKFDGELRFHIHEDVLNEQLSQEVETYARSCGLYQNVKIDRPPIGQGASLTWLLNQTSSKYIFNIEDDFELLREVDLDKVIWIMDRSEITYTIVNQICFNKRQTMSEKPSFKKMEIQIDGQKLTTNPHWALIPAIWRSDYIKSRWLNFKQGNHWDLNTKLKGQRANRDAWWVTKNTGTYYWGPIGELEFVKHIGFQKSVREGEEQQNWRI